MVEKLSVQPQASPERLILSCRSRIHFQEALDVAVNTKGSDIVNVIVGVASSMAETNTPPVSALERLIFIRDGLPTEVDENKINHREFMELGMAKINGMLGRHSEMRSLITSPEKDETLWAISPFTYAGEENIRRGEDPTPILEEAMDRVGKSKAHWGDNHFGKVIEYARIGKIFHKAGLDPKAAFSKAEDEITRAKQDARHFDNRSCLELASVYAQCGYFDNALKMIDKLDMKLIGKDQSPDMVAEHRKHKVREILDVVLGEQLAQGDVSGAIETAKKLGWPRPMIKALARKAVSESEQGVNPSLTITEALREAGSYSFPEEPELYEEAYPLLALALAKYGKDEEAREMFSNIGRMIKDLDLAFRPDAGFALARAIDDAGYDATDFFRQVFDWADEAKEKHELYWDVYEVGIHSLIERGHFDLAKEYLDKYSEYPWPKSRLIAELAGKEAKRGLTQEEINGLSQEEIQAIIAGDNESAKEAALYFGLDKKVQ